MCQSAIDWNLQPVVATCMRQLTYIELEVLLAGKAKKVKLMAQHVLHDADSKVWSQAAQVQSAVDAAWSTSKPWILSSAAACFEGGGVPAAIKNFMAIFKDSSIRVTEGRAQAGTSADVAQKVQAALAKMVPGNFVGCRLSISRSSQSLASAWQLPHLVSRLRMFRLGSSS